MSFNIEALRARLAEQRDERQRRSYEQEFPGRPLMQPSNEEDMEFRPIPNTRFEPIEPNHALSEERLQQMREGVSNSWSIGYDTTRPTSWEDVHESINQIKENLFEHLQIEDPDSYENIDVKVRRKLAELLNNYSWRGILENEPSLTEADCPQVTCINPVHPIHFRNEIRLEYRCGAELDSLSLPEPVFRALREDFLNIDVFLWWLISRGLFPSVPSPSQVQHLLVILNSWLYRGGVVPYIKGFTLFPRQVAELPSLNSGEVYTRIGEYPVEICFSMKDIDESNGDFRIALRTKFIRFDIAHDLSRNFFTRPNRHDSPIEFIFKCVDGAWEMSHSTLIVPIVRFENPRVTHAHTVSAGYTIDMGSIFDRINRASTVWTPQEEITKTNGKHPPIKTKFLEGWEQ